MPRRVLILATVAAALAVVAMELVIRRIATEPQALPASIRRTAARPDGPLPTLWSVPGYRLVDQEGKTRTPEDLRGSVWVADFIFTSCKSICPVLTAKLVQVQRAIPDARLKFVSFSVDPERDTPEALRAYAKRWAPEEVRWTLLSTTKESLARLTKGMKTFVEPQADPDATVHSGELFLIDEQGRVRGLYSTDGDSFEQLVPDARKLLSELEGKGSPGGDTSATTAEDGATLYRRVGCAGCHDVPAIAPSLAGLGGRTVMLADGRTTTATAEYLRESILDPASKIVATYPPSMPGYRGQLTDAQVDTLVEYIQGLKAPAGAATMPVASQGAAVDPVCGMSVHAGPETLHVTHDGHTVYFCSEHCRDRFVANPSAFKR